MCDKREEKNQTANAIKGKGADFSGTLYEQCMGLYVLLRTINSKTKDFQFAQQHEHAKTFDDIVVYSGEMNDGQVYIPSRFLQLKYNKNDKNKLDEKSLFEKYAIFKHFISFTGIKSENNFDDIDAAEFMLVTNGKFECELEKCWEEVEHEKDVHFDADIKLYKFKFDPNIKLVSEIISEIKTNLLIQTLTDNKLDGKSERKVSDAIIRSIICIETNPDKNEKRYATISQTFWNECKLTGFYKQTIKKYCNKNDTPNKPLKEMRIELSEGFISVLTKNEVQKSTIHEQIKDFFKQFYIVNTPDYDNYFERINEELHTFIGSEYFNVQIIQDVLHTNFLKSMDKEDRVFKNKEHWQKKVNYFINQCAKMLLDRNLNDIKDESKLVQFKPQILLNINAITEENPIINVITANTTKITKLRIYCSLSEQMKNESTIFEVLGKRSDLVKRAFELPLVKLLVLYQDDSVPCEFIDIPSKNDEKHIVVITKKSLSLKCKQMHIENTLDDFDTEKAFSGKLIFYGDTIDPDCLNSNIKRAINDKHLLKLVHGESVSIGKKLDDENLAYYVDRKMIMEKGNDVDIEEIRPLLSNINNHNDETVYNEIYKANKLSIIKWNQRNTKEDKFVITNSIKKFKNTLNNYRRTRNVHWLYEYLENNYVWMFTKGSDDHIKIIVDRTLFKVKSIHDINKRIVLISAQAGMGKTTLLKNIARVSLSLNDWVVLLELGNVSKFLDDWQKNDIKITKTKAIYFLKEISLNGDLEARMFDLYYEDGKVSLLIDAYDEVTPTYTDKALELFETFNEMKFKKIWITSRSYRIVEKLEALFKAKAYNLEPFDRLTRKKSFEMRLKKCDETFNRHYFDGLVNELEKRIDEELFTLPLHCHMVLDVFEKELFGLFEPNKTFVEEDKDKLDKLINKCTLFETFIEKKFQIHFEEKSKFDMCNPSVKRGIQDMEKTYMKLNQRLALKYILPDEIFNLLKLEVDDLAPIEMGDEVGGFIEKIVDERPIFFHRTYAEYFVAKFIFEIIIKKHVDSSSRPLPKLLLYYGIYSDEGIYSFIDEMILKASPGCELHKSLKYDRTDVALQKITAAETHQLNSTDIAGRTPLIMAAIHNEHCYNELLKRPVDSTVNDLFDFSASNYYDDSYFFNKRKT